MSSRKTKPLLVRNPSILGERWGFVRVSVATLGRAPAQLGATLKAAKPVVGCPWADWKRRRRLLLPPYCSDATSLERAWLALHAKVTRNHRCRTIQKLMHRVHAYLAVRNAQGCACPILRQDHLSRDGLRACENRDRSLSRHAALTRSYMCSPVPLGVRAGGLPLHEHKERRTGAPGSGSRTSHAPPRAGPPSWVIRIGEA